MGLYDIPEEIKKEMREDLEKRVAEEKKAIIEKYGFLPEGWKPKCAELTHDNFLRICGWSERDVRTMSKMRKISMNQPPLSEDLRKEIEREKENLNPRPQEEDNARVYR